MGTIEPEQVMASLLDTVQGDVGVTFPEDAERLAREFRAPQAELKTQAEELHSAGAFRPDPVGLDLISRQTEASRPRR